jgi:hypothetical protein
LLIIDKKNPMRGMGHHLLLRMRLGSKKYAKGHTAAHLPFSALLKHGEKRSHQACAIGRDRSDMSVANLRKRALIQAVWLATIEQSGYRAPIERGSASSLCYPGGKDQVLNRFRHLPKYAKKVDMCQHLW